MVKHLWRNNSYVKVEKEDPGCVWTLFRVLDYLPWQNVKKMLPHKPFHGRGKGKPKHSSIIGEFEGDLMSLNSESVNSSTYGTESVGKKSKKSRVVALSVDEENLKNSNDLNQQPQMQDHEGNWAEFSPPTLLSLLKTAPKLIRKINSAKELSNFKTSFLHKNKEEKYVGALELFRVNQDLFLKVLDDNSTENPRLAKSGTFPSSTLPQNAEFGRTPSKIETKHKEVWPAIMSPDNELKRAKSRRMGRSSSLKESVDRYEQLLDTTNSNKGIQKRLSRSFKMTNEREFTLLGDHHRQKSFSERLALLEESPGSFKSSELSRATLERLSSLGQGQFRASRLDSARGFGGPDYNSDNSAEVLLDEQWEIFEVAETVQKYEKAFDVPTATKPDSNNHITSISAWDAYFTEDRIKNLEYPTSKDSFLSDQSNATLDNAKETDNSDDQFMYLEEDIDNMDLQYVKYILEVVLGFLSGDETLGVWYSTDEALDPALFDGIEVCCPFNPKTSKKDAAVISSSSHRKFLFDLINEALVEMYEKSYDYYPNPLSFSCNIRPMPKGNRQVLEQVWEFVSKCLSWRPELDPEFDLAVAHDMSKNRTGWKNLQIDTEYLALDLEDFIFDELLNEIVCY